MACCAGCGSGTMPCDASEGTGMALHVPSTEARMQALHRNTVPGAGGFTLLEAELCLDVQDAHARQPIDIRIV